MSADDPSPPPASQPAVGALARDEIARRIHELGPWFHNMDLGGVPTAPDHFLGDYPRVKFAGFSDALPKDLGGRSVLDIGCNGGFYAIEMKRRGAGRVVAIDSDPHYLAQARFAAEVSGYPDIEFAQLNVYDVAELGERFDLVIFMGVFYHLRHPLLALDLIHEHVAGDLLAVPVHAAGERRGGEGRPRLRLQRDGHVRRARMAQAPLRRARLLRRLGPTGSCQTPPPPRPCCAPRGFDVVNQVEQEVYLCRRRELDAARAPYAVYPARG